MYIKQKKSRTFAKNLKYSFTDITKDIQYTYFRPINFHSLFTQLSNIKHYHIHLSYFLDKHFFSFFYFPEGKSKNQTH